MFGGIKKAALRAILKKKLVSQGVDKKTAGMMIDKLLETGLLEKMAKEIQTLTGSGISTSKASVMVFTKYQKEIQEALAGALPNMPQAPKPKPKKGGFWRGFRR